MQYQPTQLYHRAGFSSPAQASFFLICTGDSADAGYHPHVMPRSAVFGKMAQNLLFLRVEILVTSYLLCDILLSVILNRLS